MGTHTCLRSGFPGHGVPILMPVTHRLPSERPRGTEEEFSGHQAGESVSFILWAVGATEGI